MMNGFKKRMDYAKDVLGMLERKNAPIRDRVGRPQTTILAEDVVREYVSLLKLLNNYK